MSTVTTAGSLRLETFAGCRVVYRMQPQGDIEYRFLIGEAKRSRHGIALIVEGSEEKRHVGSTRSFAPVPPPESPIGTFYVPSSARAVVGKKRIRILNEHLKPIATLRRV